MNFELIRKKTQKIKDLDPKSKSYKFLPKVSDVYLKEFEQKFNVELPLDFRKFISEIACGIVDKVFNSNIIDDIKFYEHSVKDETKNPSIEFPLTKRTCAYKESEEYEKDYPLETEYKPFKYNEFSNGILPILDEGCGCFSFIVVKGKEYGNIWFDNYCSNSEIAPELDNENNYEKMSFEKWINKKLDKAIVRLE